MKTFKITSNGFIKVTSDGVTRTYFYHNGDEKYWIASGYTQVISYRGNI